MKIKKISTEVYPAESAGASALSRTSGEHIVEKLEEMAIVINTLIERVNKMSEEKDK